MGAKTLAGRLKREPQMSVEMGRRGVTSLRFGWVGWKLRVELRESMIMRMSGLFWTRWKGSVIGVAWRVPVLGEVSLMMLPRRYW